MSNILVLDVAASESGQVTILKDFYNKFKENKENHYFFCVSVIHLENSENITVLEYPWVKKTWFHRLFFDYIIAPILLNKYRIDEVFSLQNSLIPLGKRKSVLYLHQGIPFVEQKYSIKENFKFWLYQNISSNLIFDAVKKADVVYVQTKWMKKAAIEKCGIKEDKIFLDPPHYEVDTSHQFDEKNWEGTFIYPATYKPYKKHKNILDAVEILNEKGIHDFKVLFTLRYDELSIEDQQFVDEHKDNVELIGVVERSHLYELYSRSCLLYPSNLESFGLPLLEAKTCNCPILSARTVFALEILEGYEKVSYFEVDDTKKLSELMEELLEKRGKRS